MKRFFRTFFGSFYNPATYAQTRDASHGWGLMYALGVVAFIVGVGVVVFTVFFYSILLKPHGDQPALADALIEQIAAQWPEMTLAENTLQVHAPQPYTIRTNGDLFDSNYEGDLITIDTTGKTTYQNMRTPLLITRTDVISKSGQGKTELRSLSEIVKPEDQPLVVDRAMIERTAASLHKFAHRTAWVFLALAAPLMWMIITGILFIFRLFMLIALGGVGLLLSNVSRGTKLSYMASVRLASVAYTPVAVIGTLAFVVSMHSLTALVSFALGALMLLAAITVTQPEKA